MKKADSRFANHTLQLLTINTWPGEWRVTSYLHEQAVFKMVITSPHPPKNVLHHQHRNVGSILSLVKIHVLQLLTSLPLMPVFWEAESRINGKRGGISILLV